MINKRYRLIIIAPPALLLHPRRGTFEAAEAFPIKEVQLFMVPFLLRYKREVYNTLNVLVLTLSAGLIVYLSVLAFRNIQFFSDRSYMTFQLWVCYAFIADFFIELYMSSDKKRYIRRRWLFLLLSIPFLNIVAGLRIAVPYTTLYFLRFIPLARAALAMALIVSYLSRSRLVNIFWSYTIVLLTTVYIGSLIFYEVERLPNPEVTSYWDALWWAASVAATVGCDIYPVTVAGKIVCAILPTMGTVMFPLIAVVVTNAIQTRLNSSNAIARKREAAKTD